MPNNKTVTLYLIRHGFHMDDKLTREGREGVEKSAKNNLMGKKFIKAYSSPALRAKETMEIILNVIGSSLKVECRKGLGPDGDSLAEIKSIAREVALDAALSEERNVIIVTHSQNMLACSGECPTMPTPNYADIIKCAVEVGEVDSLSLTRITLTQRIPRG